MSEAIVYNKNTGIYYLTDITDTQKPFAYKMNGIVYPFISREAFSYVYSKLNFGRIADFGRVDVPYEISIRIERAFENLVNIKNKRSVYMVSRSTDGITFIDADNSARRMVPTAYKDSKTFPMSDLPGDMQKVLGGIMSFKSLHINANGYYVPREFGAKVMEELKKIAPQKCAQKASKSSGISYIIDKANNRYILIKMVNGRRIFSHEIATKNPRVIVDPKFKSVASRIEACVKYFDINNGKILNLNCDDGEVLERAYEASKLDDIHYSAILDGKEFRIVKYGPAAEVLILGVGQVQNNRLRIWDEFMDRADILTDIYAALALSGKNKVPIEKELGEFCHDWRKRPTPKKSNEKPKPTEPIDDISLEVGGTTSEPLKIDFDLVDLSTSAIGSIKAIEITSEY